MAPVIPNKIMKTHFEFFKDKLKTDRPTDRQTKWHVQVTSPYLKSLFISYYPFKLQAMSFKFGESAIDVCKHQV